MYFYIIIFAYLVLFVQSMIETVDELDVSKYIGLWYQVYGSPFDFTFQGYGKCITADYELLPTGILTVFNTQLNVKNELQAISGYAYYENKNEPGKLTVHLDGSPKDAPYWVVKLGEIYDEEYQYSVITTPTGIAMWVLARNVDTFTQKYDLEVRKYLYANNYTYIPIQQTQCLEDLLLV